MNYGPVINVQPGTGFGHCRMFGKPFRKCKLKTKFLIFGDDGKPKSSRLEGCVCEKHLAAAVRELKKRQVEELVKGKE